MVVIGFGACGVVLLFVDVGEVRVVERSGGVVANASVDVECLGVILCGVFVVFLSKIYVSNIVAYLNGYDVPIADGAIKRLLDKVRKDGK